jgi:hypothetical protein
MRKIIGLLAVVAGTALAVPAGAVAPYQVAAQVSGGEVDAVMAEAEQALEGAGFEVLGGYHPMQSPEYGVVVVTHPAIRQAIQKVPQTEHGGQTIVGAGLRVGFRAMDESGAVEVSYTTPEYWHRAYFQEAYAAAGQSAVAAVAEPLARALAGLGESANEAFGGDLAAGDLEYYQYMMGMPYMYNAPKVGQAASFSAMVDTIRANLEQGVAGTARVYEVVLPGAKKAVFGVAMHDGDTGVPSWFPSLVQRHVAALPYEIYVDGAEARTLHGRFRIALAWPELSMGTFMGIRAAPGKVETTMRRVAGSSPE